MRYPMPILCIAVLVSCGLAADTVTINVGDNFQEMANSHPAYTVFKVKRGIHRQQTVRPKEGQEFIGEDGAILDGEEEVRTAIHAGAAHLEDNVKIKNLEIRNYRDPAFVDNYLKDCGGAALAFAESDGWVVENCDVHHNGGVGINIGGKARIINNTVWYNYQHGLAGHHDSSVVIDNEIAWNNWDPDKDTCRCHWGHSAGGTKFSVCTTMTLQGNWAHNNWGPGLWNDHANVYIDVKGNLLEDNVAHGFFHEISEAATIHCNIIRNNGTSPDRDYGNKQIVIIAGNEVKIYKNIIRINSVGSAGIDMGFSDRNDVPIETGYECYENQIWGPIGWGIVAGGGISSKIPETYWEINGTVFDRNTYHVLDPADPVWWWQSKHIGWDEFRAMGQEPNGTVDTDLDAEAVCPDGCEDLLAPAMLLSPHKMCIDAAQGAKASKDMRVLNRGIGNLEPPAASVKYHDGDGWLTISSAVREGKALVMKHTANATGLAKGEYLARVTLSAANAAKERSYLVYLNVGDGPRATSIQVTPANGFCAPGETIPYRAVVLDQFGQPLAHQPGSFSWSASGGGTINGSGMFSAGAERDGPFAVTAAASGLDGSASITVLTGEPFTSDWITRWLQVQNGSGSGLLPFSGDFTAEHIAGEADLYPRKGDQATVGGTSCTWNIAEDADGWWSDDNSKDNFLSYYSITIISPADQTGRVGFRYKDGVRLWVNGEKVFDDFGYDGNRIKSSVEFPLYRGPNRFLFKHAESTGGNHFAARIVRGDGADLEGCYYTLWDGAGEAVAGRTPVITPARITTPVVRQMKNMVRVSTPEALPHALRIVSFNGQTVWSTEGLGSRHYAIGKRQLPSGVYLLRVSAGKATRTTRLCLF
ncbi:MAG: hypothetical protein GF418_13315 [Chitinivibrionales bacterium]|nr:hypothetical protein [Chitinivibrionales bacterium]MBD3396598.1 hypothetical protein [Chitinivibrionales bacterium]